jgi:hypothetical protein
MITLNTHHDHNARCMTRRCPYNGISRSISTITPSIETWRHGATLRRSNDTDNFVQFRSINDFFVVFRAPMFILMIVVITRHRDTTSHPIADGFFGGAPSMAILIDLTQTAHAMNVLRESMGVPVHPVSHLAHAPRHDDAVRTDKTKYEHVAVTARDVRNIPLKTIYDDIMRANPTSTLTPKKMRDWLRVNFRDRHNHNDPWVFSLNEYDIVRSAFDVVYARTCYAK